MTFLSYLLYIVLYGGAFAFACSAVYGLIAAIGFTGRPLTENKQFWWAEVSPKWRIKGLEFDFVSKRWIYS